MRTRLVLVVLIALLAGGLVLTLSARRALASGTLLEVAEGEVYFTHDGVEQQARDQQSLGEKDEVRTGPDGHAVILFFDGSTLTLDPSTTVRLDAARTEDGAALVDVFQTAGSTWHAVQRVLSPGSRYEVTTPGLSASVRGTAFQVRVGDGEDEVVTEEGTVDVRAQLDSVRVTPGLRTIVRRGAAPARPEQAPRPRALLRIELVGGAGLLVDGSRRSVGVLPDGSVRNAIPGARIEREGDVVRIVVPNPTRDLRFVAGAGLDAVRYAVTDETGQTLASGQTTAGSGPVPQVFPQLRDTVPDRTPTPPARTAAPSGEPTRDPSLTSPSPSGSPSVGLETPAPIRTLAPTATPALTAPPTIRTPSPSPQPSVAVTTPPPAVTTRPPTPAPTAPPATPAPTTAPPPVALSCPQSAFVTLSPPRTAQPCVPASNRGCVQGTVTNAGSPQGGVRIGGGLPGETWVSSASGFWSSGDLPAGTWDFFFGPCKRTVAFGAGQTVTLNFP